MYIHEILASKRKQLGLTQVELAKLAGVSRISVVRVEQGRDSALSIITSIAGAMGLALDLVDEKLVLERTLLELRGKKSSIDSQIELVETLINNGSET